MSSYSSLQDKFGDIVAQSILMDIERHLKLDSSRLAAVDPEIRLRAALALLGESGPASGA